MRGVAKEIIVKARADFDRGFIEENDKGSFYTLYIRALPNYEYSNWTEHDLAELREAIDFVLGKKSTPNQQRGKV